MRECFADAFFYFAWWNPGDAAHTAALSFIRRFSGRLVTTRWVLMEVADGFASLAGRKDVRRLFRKLAAQPDVLIVEPDSRQAERALDLYDARPDKKWSLTDCTSFIVMGDLGISEALTGDKHFEQAGFVALLK
jgi:predicted nucleic acid-binding protein